MQSISPKQKINKSCTRMSEGSLQMTTVKGYTYSLTPSDLAMEQAAFQAGEGVRMHS